MKTYKTLLSTLFAVGAVCVMAGTANASCLSGATSCTEDTTVQLTIDPGDICIGSTGSFDFGTYTVSSSSQTVNGTFTDEFRVDDLKGDDDGYYTTLQLQSDLTGQGTATIPRSNVSVQAAGLTTMAGSANPRVELDGGMSAYQTLDTARTYIQRTTQANAGVVGKYGAFPQLQVVIPAYQSVGTYTSTLVYTLYEN